MNLLKEYIKTILVEKRRLHDPDRRKTNLDKLLNYVSQRGLFFHATNKPDIQGVNIKMTYSNPLGIYAYPLTKKYLNRFLKGNLMHSDMQQKYAIILKPKGMLVKASTYTWEQLENDCKKLGLSFEDVKKGRGPMSNDDDHPINGLMYLIFGGNVSLKRRALANMNLRKLGYSGIYSNNDLFAISYDIGSEALFVGSDVIEIIDIVQNPQYGIMYGDEGKQKFNFVNSSREEQLKQLEIHPRLIKTLKNPDEEMQMKVLKSLGDEWAHMFFTYVKKPSENIQMYLAKTNPEIFFKNVLGFIKKEVISQNVIDYLELNYPNKKIRFG